MIFAEEKYYDLLTDYFIYPSTFDGYIVCILSICF